MRVTARRRVPRGGAPRTALGAQGTLRATEFGHAEPADFRARCNTFRRRAAGYMLAAQAKRSRQPAAALV
jgi:hypothetical protein